MYPVVDRATYVR